MGIRRKNLAPDAVLHRAHNAPYMIRRPKANTTAVALQQVVAVGANLALGGVGTDVHRAGSLVAGQDCYLPIPCSLAIITQANADVPTIRIKGVDHRGKDFDITRTKTVTNRQTLSDFPVCPQYIEFIQLVSHNTPANHLRVGFLYTGFAFGAGDLSNRLANDFFASVQFLPLEVNPNAPSDQIAVVCTNIGTTFDTPGGDIGGVVPAYTYLDSGGALATDGGIALGKRVPPVAMGPFGVTYSAVDVVNGVLRCFLAATTDPAGTVEFAQIINPKTLVNR